MYKIKAEGKEYYSDTLVYVKKAPNGCYVPCLAEEAKYVVGKVPEDTIFENAEIERLDGGSALTKSENDGDEMLAIIAEAVEEKYQEDLEVINNV